MGGVYRQLQAEDYVLGLGAVDAVSGPVAGSLGFLVQQPEGTLVAEMGLGLLLSPQLAAGLAVSKPNEDWSELSARTGVALTQGPVVLGMHYDQTCDGYTLTFRSLSSISKWISSQYRS